MLHKGITLIQEKIDPDDSYYRAVIITAVKQMPTDKSFKFQAEYVID